MKDMSYEDRWLALVSQRGGMFPVDGVPLYFVRFVDTSFNGSFSLNSRLLICEVDHFDGPPAGEVLDIAAFEAEQRIAKITGLLFFQASEQVQFDKPFVDRQQLNEIVRDLYAQVGALANEHHWTDKKHAAATPQAQLLKEAVAEKLRALAGAPVPQFTGIAGRIALRWRSIKRSMLEFVESCGEYFSSRSEVEDSEPAEESEPRIMHDEVLGELVWNDSHHEWEAKIEVAANQRIRINIEAEDADASPPVQYARSLVSGFSSQDDALRRRAADELLETYNENWNHGGPIDSAIFMSRMKLESMQFKSEGSGQAWYADGGLFSGHSIVVPFGDEADRPYLCG